MKKTNIGIMAGLLGGLGIAGGAMAAPPAKAAPAAKAAVAAKPAAGAPKIAATAGKPVHTAAPWVHLKGLAFDQSLPKDWMLLEKKRYNFSVPSTGVWEFSSPDAHAKLFIRINVLRKGGFDVMEQRATRHLERKVQDLKEVGRVDLGKDAEGGQALLTVYTGLTAAFSKTAKQVMYYHHFILRYLKTYPKHELSVNNTYLFAPSQADHAKAFVQKHLEGFQLNDPIEVAQAVAEEAREDKAPVKDPLPATGQSLKKVIQKQQDAAEDTRSKK